MTWLLYCSGAATVNVFCFLACSPDSAAYRGAQICFPGSAVVFVRPARRLNIFAKYICVCIVIRQICRFCSSRMIVPTSIMVPTLRGSQGKSKYQGAKVNKDAENNFTN